VKYKPQPPPSDPQRLAQYLYQELQRIGATLNEPEATTVNYGKEYRNDLTTSAVAYTLAWRNRQKQALHLANSATAAITFAPPEGVCNLMLRLVQDSVGGRAITLPATVKWQDGVEPIWTTTANAQDVLAIYFDGSAYHATASLDSK
jgi:hypothetical protein